jgi:hypothetical protein
MMEKTMTTQVQDTGVKRHFASGATRDTAAGKVDYEGHLSPFAIEAYGQYMNFNTVTRDGESRASDNWQNGIPQDVYVKSLWRHFFDTWKWHRGLKIKENIVWALCGLLFNTFGLLHEIIKKDPDIIARARTEMEKERCEQFPKTCGK